MKKTHKIVMLPTEDKWKEGSIVANNTTEELIIMDAKRVDYWSKTNDGGRHLITQHLYILSDDEIKEGDWKYHVKIGNVWQHQREGKGFPDELKSVVSTGTKKIIATTNNKLTKVDEVSGDNVWTSPTPQIPQSLVEYYAKHQPEEVELEYEKVNLAEEGNKTKAITNCNNWVDKLKLQNNKVVWVEPIKGKMALVKVNGTLQAETLYTSEEVEELTHIAFLDGALANLKGKDMGEYWKWKKKNL